VRAAGSDERVRSFDVVEVDATADAPKCTIVARRDGSAFVRSLDGRAAELDRRAGAASIRQMRAMLGRDLVVSQVFLDNLLIAHIVDGDYRNFDTVGSMMRAVILLEMELRAMQRDVRRLNEYYLPPLDDA